MSLSGRPVVRPGTGVIGESDLLEVWRSGRKKLYVNKRSLVTHQAHDAAARLGIEIIEGPPEQPSLPATDGIAAMRRLLYKSNPRWVASDRPRGLNPTTFGRLVIVGAGGVGSASAHLAANSSIADELILIDIVPGIAEATALDLEHSVGITGSRSRFTGGANLALMEGADVVVITAGRPRTPGMSRSDLAEVNGRVVRQTCERLAEVAPDAVVVVVTNPLDEMTTEALRATGFPRERVIGMAGTLDSARFRAALARAAAVDPRDVEAITLGSHGDEMVPIISTATIRGHRLEDMLAPEAIQASVKSAVTGGGQVVAIRKTGSATLAPAHATLEVLDALRGARVGVIPVSVMLRGEYGIENVVLGVPCLLGPGGVSAIVELPLADDELESLQAAAAAVAARIGG